MLEGALVRIARIQSIWWTRAHAGAILIQDMPSPRSGRTSGCLAGITTLSVFTDQRRRVAGQKCSPCPMPRPGDAQAGTDDQSGCVD